MLHLYTGRYEIFSLDFDASFLGTTDALSFVFLSKNYLHKAEG